MSGYLDENIEMSASNNTDPFDEDFEESNEMHGNQCIWQGVFNITSLSAFHLTTHCRSHILSSISGVSSVFSYSSLYYFVQMLFISAVNGRMYGNLAGLEMCAGDKVIWYTFGLGTEVDIHGVFFEGNTFEKQNTTRDTLSLFSHTTAAVAMQPNTPG